MGKIAEKVKVNKKALKKALLRGVRISPPAYHTSRKKLIDTHVVLPKRTVIKDINKMRQLWATGYSDLEIRKKMGLTFEQWKKRLDRMRAVPPEDDTVRSFKRYFFEHTKYIAKLERRQRRLNKLYEKSMEKITTVSRGGLQYTRPRDLELARALMVDLANVDKDILKAEQDLVNMKQKLGIIDQEPPRVEITGVFNVGVLEQAWALRKQKQLTPTHNDNQKAYIEDALLVEPPDIEAETASNSLNNEP